MVALSQLAQNAKRADVKAVTLASSLVCLRCRACEFLFIIEDRRSGVRPHLRAGSFPSSGGVSDRLLQRHSLRYGDSLILRTAISDG